MRTFYDWRASVIDAVHEKIARLHKELEAAPRDDPAGQGELLALIETLEEGVARLDRLAVE